MRIFAVFYPERAIGRAVVLDEDASLVLNCHSKFELFVAVLLISAWKRKDVVNIVFLGIFSHREQRVFFVVPHEEAWHLG